MVSRQRERLREARQRAGLSQVGLAERAGVHHVTVARLELDQHRPSVDAALALARALGVTVEWLFGDGSDNQQQGDEGVKWTAIKRDPKVGTQKQFGRWYIEECEMDDGRKALLVAVQEGKDRWLSTVTIPEQGAFTFRSKRATGEDGPLAEIESLLQAATKPKVVA
jgi:transcriptional regulator with XRE-family HTH domain